MIHATAWRPSTWVRTNPWDAPATASWKLPRLGGSRSCPGGRVDHRQATSWARASCAPCRGALPRPLQPSRIRLGCATPAGSHSTTSSFLLSPGPSSPQSNTNRPRGALPPFLCPPSDGQRAPTVRPRRPSPLLARRRRRNVFRPPRAQDHQLAGSLSAFSPPSLPDVWCACSPVPLLRPPFTTCGRAESGRAAVGAPDELERKIRSNSPRASAAFPTGGCLAIRTSRAR